MNALRFDLTDAEVVRETLTAAGATLCGSGDWLACGLFWFNGPTRTTLCVKVAEVEGRPVAEVVEYLKSRL